MDPRDGLGRMMTPEEEQAVREVQAELAAAEGSPWEPACVAGAFAAKKGETYPFTMQAWIDLEAARSPFLLGRMPEAESALDHFRLALAAFGHPQATPEECSPQELLVIGQAMGAAIAAAFAMRLQLAPPEGCQRGGESGLGGWLPLLACLVSQIGLSLAEALGLPVARAFALLAAHRCNQGWSVCGETYTQRGEAA